MKNRIKKFSTIFAKRVAASAVPNSCQNCECTGHNSGVAYMICTSCERDTSDGFDDYVSEKGIGGDYLYLSQLYTFHF